MSDDLNDADSANLRAEAARVGLVDSHYDAFGQFTRVSDEILRLAMQALSPPDQPVSESSAPCFLPVKTLVHRAADDALRVPLYWTPEQGAGEWEISWEEDNNEDIRRPLSGRFEYAELEHAPNDKGLPQATLWLHLHDLPLGYHRLNVRASGGGSDGLALIVVPNQCWLPEGATDTDNPDGSAARFWGVTCQLHGLRSHTDWGIGDFSCLTELSRQVGSLGGDLVGLNPLNALFLTRPLHASPYSPNSRLFLNPLYIGIGDIPETGETAAIALLSRGLESLRRPDLIDLGRVVPRKIRALEACYETFTATHLGQNTQRERDYLAFVEEGGRFLRDFARFQTISEHFGDRCGTWEEWPEGFQDPASDTVTAFSQDNEDRVGFHLWCQFEADRQLGLCAQAARSSGQRLGIYRDLAIGSDPSGADAWMMGDSLVRGFAVGAPPDPMNARGQDWGFSPFHPQKLIAEGLESFRRLIRASMRHAGALRIDHVLGLMRVFSIVRGYPCKDGLYLNMPFREMLGVLCLESHRARCMVVGEDLGTIPDGFRDQLQAVGILSSRLFYFERHWEAGATLMRPDEYPRLAAVSANSHDLPTLRGFWAGRDLAWKNELDLFPTDEAREQESQRRFADRPMIQETLARAGIILDPAVDYDPPANLVPAVTEWLAGTPSLLVTVQMEDVLEETEQANLPGTVEEHPNWRRRLPVPVETLTLDGRLERLAAVFAARNRGTRSIST